MTIAAIDWSPVTNQIITCSHDRNGFVWSVDANGDWSPSLVILRLGRAALDCKWSHDGRKFAVASGAKVVAICYHHPTEDWWVSKHTSKHKSSVLSVSWHPNNHMIATASTDFRCRVISAYCEEFEGTAQV